MSYNSTIFSQVLQQVNRYDFKNQVSKHNGDKGTSKFRCFPILVIMLYMQLKIKFSLRGITSGINIFQNNFYHLGMNGLDKVSRTSLSDALKSRPAKVFEDYFYSLLEKVNQYENRSIRRLRCRKKKLKILDSTTISLCKELYNWAKFRKTKSGIKLHTIFDPQLLAPVKVFITNAKKHDINIVSKIKIEKGQMYVFDRGYNDYKYWYSIDLARGLFVTRLKKNSTYQIIKKKRIMSDNGVKSDCIIRITGTKANEYPKELRLVAYYDEETKKNFKFVTNDFRSSAKEIANIYKTRWMIELFFKWIKQHLSIKKFVSTTENGVKIQIWTALILYLLLLLIKYECKEKVDLFEIFRRIQEALMERMDINFLI